MAAQIRKCQKELVQRLAQSAFGEERKFALLLASPLKSYEVPQEEIEFPNPDDIWEHYFDLVKNSGEERVDSFAEYWHEISYGTVSVSGEVYGWIEVPWRTVPLGREGLEDPMAGSIHYTDLNVNGYFNRFEGEDVPFEQNQKILIDYNGDSVLTGKSLFTDLREGNMTYPLLLALERDVSLRPVVDRVLERPSSEPLSAGSKTQVLDSLDSTGALRDCLRLARWKADAAVAELGGIPAGRGREALVTVAEAAVQRRG